MVLLHVNMDLKTYSEFFFVNSRIVSKENFCQLCY